MTMAKAPVALAAAEQPEPGVRQPEAAERQPEPAARLARRVAAEPQEALALPVAVEPLAWPVNRRPNVSSRAPRLRRRIARKNPQWKSAPPIARQASTVSSPSVRPRSQATSSV